MAYSEYIGRGSIRPRIVPSPSESERAGLKVGRLLCGSSTAWETFDPTLLLAQSDLDLVIMRYPSEQVGIAEKLSSQEYTCFLADTLLYLSVDLTGSTRKPSAVSNYRLSACASESRAPLVTEIFRGYTNHYSANSLLGGLATDSAYADWADSQSMADHKEFLQIENSLGQVVGIAVLDLEEEGWDELTLVGIVPQFRRQGILTDLLELLKERAGDRGKPSLVTSTQTHTLYSLRGFCDAGLRPCLSLNTLHIVKY